MTARKLKAVETEDPVDRIPIGEVVKYLSGLGLFRGIRNKPEALAYFAEKMHEENFAKGKNIFSIGDMDDRMFCLMQGEAEVTKVTLDGDHFRVAVLKAEDGAVFGEGALLDADSRSATIKALVDCRCLVMDRKTFHTVCEEYPGWALPVLNQIAWAVMDRLRRLNGDFTLLYSALVKQIRGE